MRGDQLAQLVEIESYAIQVQLDLQGYIAYNMHVHREYVCP